MPYTNRIIATVTCPGVSIKEIQVIGPYGLTTQSEVQISATQWYIDFSWSPDNTQTGSNLICYLATDSNDMSSVLNCIRAVVMPTIPKPISATPIGLLTSTYLLGVGGLLSFQLNFDTSITRPTINGYIRIVHSNGTVMASVNTKDASKVSFSSTSLSFKLPIYTFPPGDYRAELSNNIIYEYQTVPTPCSGSTASYSWNFTIPTSSL